MSAALIPAHDPVEFDAAVASFRYHSPLQSWAYGQARATIGDVPARFFLEVDGTRVGAAQILRRRFAPGITRLYAPRGPAVDDPAVLTDFAAALRAVAGRSDAFAVIEPPLAIPSEQPIPEGLGPWRRTETEQPEHTLVVTLDQDQEQMFAGLHKMARRNVRTADRMGVQTGREDDFEAFMHLFQETNTRAQIAPHPSRYYETLWAEGNKYGSEVYAVLARHEGMALAGGVFLGLGDHTCYLYGGSIRDPRENEDGSSRKDAKAPDSFYWNSILDAQSHGYSVLDLWGIPRELNEDKHSYGIYRMKLKYTQERVNYPAYLLPLNPLARPLLQAKRWHRNWTNYRTRGTTDDIL